MAGASADGEINYWPAFVDVLTTVIMVVTFLLVIMCAAIMTLSQSVVKQMKANVDAEVTRKVEIARAAQSQAGAMKPSPSTALMSQTLQSGDPTIIALARSIAESPKVLVKGESDEQPTQATGTIVRDSSALLRVEFDPTATKLAPDSASAASEIIRSANIPPNAKLEIWSTAPAFGSVSVAERQAYYRAVDVRTMLMKAGINASRIRGQIKVSNEPNVQHQVVVLVKD